MLQNISQTPVQHVVMLFVCILSDDGILAPCSTPDLLADIDPDAVVMNDDEVANEAESGVGDDRTTHKALLSLALPTVNHSALSDTDDTESDDEEIPTLR